MPSSPVAGQRPTALPSTRRMLVASVAALGLLAAGVPAAAQDAGGGSNGGATLDLQGRVLEPGGAAISGAFVQVEAVDDTTRWRGAETDELGYWHMEGLVPGAYRVWAERIGYATTETVVELEPTGAAAGDGADDDGGGGAVGDGGGSARIDVPLVMEPEAVEIAGISVEAARSRERVRFETVAGTTTRELAVRDIRIIPGIIEADPLRAVEILPGVVTTSDFSSAYNVRGGSADQNLILLDGVPIFNPTHLGGFFSIFNADMIDRAELSSGGFPARFGGRVSSVLEIETDPGTGELQGSGGVSLLATRMALGSGTTEGLNDALGLSRGRWRASARRSYFDVLLRPVTEFPYHLNDFQGFFEGWTGGGDRITFTSYSGRDVLDLSRLDQEDFPLVIDWSWGNDAVGVEWSSPRPDGGALRSRVSWTSFDSRLVFPDFDDTSFRSEIQQLQTRLSLESRPRGGLTLSTGIGADRYFYDNVVVSGGTEFASGGGTGWQLQGWIQSEWNVDSRWIVELGLRNDVWLGDPGGTRWVVSPRLSARRFLGEEGDWAVKASAGRYSQFLHSIRDEELPIGLDFWVLTGDRTPAVVSDQAQIGIEGYPATGWFGSLEAYVRNFDGVTTPNRSDDPNERADDFLAGTGLSYGVDLLARRSVGSTTGWLSVSWLKAERTFPDPLVGLEPPPTVEYPPVFDRRLDVDLAVSHRVGEEWELGLRWNFGTGLPYTRPVASYHYFRPRSLFGGSVAWSGDEEDDEGGFGVILGPRNGSRYPVRHRLDVSVRRSFEQSWGTLVPYLSVLNVYNRKNVLFYFYEYDRNPPVRSGISMFPLLPTVGLDVSF